ncbi:MAG: CPBP family intramembrane metalloprotease [Deltaproteobacteria bacterium]|nr:CPBP family intramembrane metalloprotease [Deltaproteobacteria bacterium]
MVLVLPLFVAYQVGILFSGGVRNGADFVTDTLLLAIRTLMSLPTGAPSEPAQGDVLLAYLGVNLLVGLLLLAVVWHFRRRGRFSSKLFPLLLLESSVYAIFFSTVVALMMRVFGLDGLLRASFEVYASLLSTPALAAPALAAGVTDLSLIDRVVMSIGAGLYEELVFRLFLMGGLFHLFSRTLSLPKIGAALLALLLSSLVFSGVHHLGNMGEVFSLGAFTYRFFAGLLLAVIFHVRGFAVAVYTHALYDVLVLVLRG